MKFNLIFDNSNDCIEFETVANEDLLRFFVDKANTNGHNSFTDDHLIHKEVDRLLTEHHWSISKTNEVLFDLSGKNFPQKDSLLDYLEQNQLNQQHAHWVHSQKTMIDIDQLRWSSNHRRARLGERLHDLYPDDIRIITLAEALTKLGYIFPYEEINMTIHRLEHFFTRRIEFRADAKWSVFDNPFHDSMISNNHVVNLCFGYTYVGRQYYDKWHFFDTDLEYDDHYNYETLEWAFQITLDRPQTIPYSVEFLSWCERQNVKPISTQLPIANVVDLEKKLSYYRGVLYKNSRQGNRAKIQI